MKIVSNSFNELFVKSAEMLDKHGDLTKPRGLPCQEVLWPQLVLTNPLDCLITLPERKLNYAYAIIEKFMYLSQKSDVDVICHYNSGMTRYINPETKQFDGAYGLRIAKSDQFNWCYEKLLQDPDTRQAVITIHDHTDCRETLDPACTMSFQFFIRESKLHMVVNMRSNDLLWGTCLDVQAFCFLQQVMASWLGLELGDYVHQPASLHYYLDKKDHVTSVVNDFKNLKYIKLLDEQVPAWDVPRADHQDRLNEFWEKEALIRTGAPVDLQSPSKAITYYLTRLKKYNDLKRQKAESKVSG